MMQATVIGAGLAGSEAAWQLAQRGVRVTLREMKPQKMSPAHTSEYFAELVCSNSLRGAGLENAVGLLKEELRRLGSLILAAADETRVEAGGALAVDRHGFARRVTEAIRSHPNITVEAGEVTALPETGEVLVATGPLTSDALADHLLARTGGQALHFFDAAAPLVRKLSRPAEEGRTFDTYARLLAAPERKLKVIHRQLKDLLTRGTRRQVENLTKTVSLFRRDHDGMVLYAMDDGQGGTMLCATISDLTAQLRQTLWRQLRPVILTSGTMAVGEDFRRFKEETGLLADSRVMESVSLSPFDYEKNCLLYLPQHPPHQKAADYYNQLAGEIAALLKAAQGHALVLFTSYAAMSAVKERLKGQTPYPLFTMGRNAVHTMEQFKGQPGSVLLATGAAWEGFDFPGDCVSLLIIPRLPFAVPDALKEKERENHPTLRLFIRAVVVPEMQIKLKQGFGRAIRTETDTCVVAILDERSAPGQRHHEAMLAALPDLPQTSSLEDVVEFIYRLKGPDYFREGKE